MKQGKPIESERQTFCDLFNHMSRKRLISKRYSALKHSGKNSVMFPNLSWTHPLTLFMLNCSEKCRWFPLEKACRFYSIHVRAFNKSRTISLYIYIYIFKIRKNLIKFFVMNLESAAPPWQRALEYTYCRGGRPFESKKGYFRHETKLDLMVKPQFGRLQKYGVTFHRKLFYLLRSNQCVKNICLEISRIWQNT